jgi:hypothetical protein
MVCYARRATVILSVAIVALMLYGADTAHLFDAGRLLMSLATVFAGAAVMAGLTFVALRAVQHRRALAGGCVGCQFSCQHAMTAAASGGDDPHIPAPFPPRRMWLVNSADRGITTDLGMPSMPVPRIPAPRQPVRARAGGGRPATGPHWPDRPLRTTVRSE